MHFDLITPHYLSHIPRVHAQLHILVTALGERGIRRAADGVL